MFIFRERADSGIFRIKKLSPGREKALPMLIVSSTKREKFEFPKEDFCVVFDGVCAQTKYKRIKKSRSDLLSKGFCFSHQTES